MVAACDVAWRLDGAVELINFCHCSMCRKLHGAPFGAFAHARTEGFRWLRGKATMQRDRRASRPYADWVCLPAESRSSEDPWLPI
ncbi:MAG TPA: GFA family protein [Casimicrobiaceae bacterium]